MIHESFSSKLKTLSILYDSGSFWETVLCNNTTNSEFCQGNCENCGDGKKVIVSIDPEKNVFCNECKYIDNKFQVMR